MKHPRYCTGRTNIGVVVALKVATSGRLPRLVFRSKSDRGRDEVPVSKTRCALRPLAKGGSRAGYEYHVETTQKRRWRQPKAGR